MLRRRLQCRLGGEIACVSSTNGRFCKNGWKLRIRPLVGADAPRDGAVASPCSLPKKQSDSDWLANKDGRACHNSSIGRRIRGRCGGRVAQQTRGGKGDRVKEDRTWEGGPQILGVRYEACEEKKMIIKRRECCEGATSLQGYTKCGREPN